MAPEVLATAENAKSFYTKDSDNSMAEYPKVPPPIQYSDELYNAFSTDVISPQDSEDDAFIDDEEEDSIAGDEDAYEDNEEDADDDKYEDDNHSSAEDESIESSSFAESSEDEAWNSRKKKTKKTKKKLPVKRKGVLLSSDEEDNYSRKRKIPVKKPLKSSNDFAVSDESESTDNEELINRRKSSPADPTIPFPSRQARAIEAILLADSNNERFLIKWKNLSHWNNTWEDPATINQLPGGQRRLQNFLLHQISPATDRPEMEEQVLAQLEQWRTLERVISCRKGSSAEEGDWYLCKWTGQPYAACTWERAARVFGPEECNGSSLVNRYVIRMSQGGMVPSAPGLWRRCTFRKLQSPPEYLGGGSLLRPYQLEGLNWLCYSWTRGTNVILADEMGLGKTIQTVSLLATLLSENGFVGPSLVVVPLSTIDAWRCEFDRWAPQLNVLCYIGDAHSRAIQRHYEWSDDGNGRYLFHVLLTTYELALKDHHPHLDSIPWRYLIVDEGHRLKNCDSQLHEALDRMAPAAARLLITGTPLQNSLQELWALLRFLMPKRFADYQEFLDRYGVNQSGGDSTGEEAQRLERLHALLKPHLLRRLKRDVEQSLPMKTEQILRVGLSAEQRSIYRMVLARNYKELAARTKGVGSLLNILVELKKVCNHPLLLGRNDEAAAHSDDLRIEASGKMDLLDQLLQRLKADGHRVLIFSQMVRMLDLLAEYMDSRHWPFQRLDGSKSSEERKRAIEHFNAPGSQDFCFLLSTRAGGLGINLTTADTVIIYDADWNPQNDLQAMARVHRIGQTKSVRIFRLVCRDTIEETIFERAKQKMVLDHLVIQGAGKERNSTVSKMDRGELQRILQFGAKTLFEEEEEKDQPVIDHSGRGKFDLDAILKEPCDAAADENGTGDDFLGQFRVANIVAKADEEETVGWDAIIPADERAKVEQESELKAQEEKDLVLQEALLMGKRRKQKSPVTTKEPKKKEMVKAKIPKQKKVNDKKKDNGLPTLSIDKEETKVLVRAMLKFGIHRLPPEGMEEAEKIVTILNVLDDGRKGETLSNGYYLAIPQLRDRLTVLENLHMILQDALATGSLDTFRIHDSHIKAVASAGKHRWTIPWTLIQDGQLLVATWIHGFGAWEEILSDDNNQRFPDLWQSLRQRKTDAQGKIVGLPQAIHLERRIEYLCATMVKTIKAQKTSSSNRKPKSVNIDSSSKGGRDDRRLLKQYFKPVRKAITDLDQLDPSPEQAKLQVPQLCSLVRIIGDHICTGETEIDEADRWTWVAQFWPYSRDFGGDQLRNLYLRIISEEEIDDEQQQEEN